MKVKKYKIIFFVYFIGLISFLFLNCQEISSQEVAALATILVVFDIKWVFKSKGEFKNLVMGYLAFFTLEVLLSRMRYGQTWSSLLYVSFELISLVLYLYFTGGIDEKRRLNLCSLFEKLYKLYLIVLYTEILLSYMGIRLLDHTVYRQRGGLIRVTAGDYLVALGTLLVWGKMISRSNQGRKNVKGDKITVILGVLYIIFVSQTRMMILATAIALACSYVIGKRSKSKRALSIIIISMLLMIMFCLPVFQRYFTNNFFGLISGDDSGMIPRIKAITHYWDYTMQRPLLGWGFVMETAKSNGIYDIYQIYRGEWGKLYTNDVGIFGYMMMFGVLGTVMFVLLIYKMFKIGLRDRYCETYKVAIAIFVIITSFSLILFDTMRQSYLVLVLLCFEMSIQSEKERQNIKAPDM